MQTNLVFVFRILSFILQSDSVWHCFTFDNSANSSDISIISLSTRPEALGRNIFTVHVPGCENEGVGQVIEIRLYCKPPTKEKNRGKCIKQRDRPSQLFWLLVYYHFWWHVDMLMASCCTKPFEWRSNDGTTLTGYLNDNMNTQWKSLEIEHKVLQKHILVVFYYKEAQEILH